MNFKANGKTYELIPDLRDKLKPGWQEMLLPAKPRPSNEDPFGYLEILTRSERSLANIGESLIGKDILEIGCGNGERSYLMARYEGTRVHGIDVDEYTVNQSPDVNVWNAEDIKFIHNKTTNGREKIAELFPDSVRKKVTFSTEGIEEYATPNKHDFIISFDVLEHILDLDKGFCQMAANIKPGGLMVHEYNPFFSINGGHSLCTLDFPFGHCLLTEKDFRRYIAEFRPKEEKIAINFYTQCLNRATYKDIKGMAKKYGFDILAEENHTPFVSPEDVVRKEIKNTILPDVAKMYPTVGAEDLLFDSICLIMRKK